MSVLYALRVGTCRTRGHGREAQGLCLATYGKCWSSAAAHCFVTSSVEFRETALGNANAHTDLPMHVDTSKMVGLGKDPRFVLFTIT